MKCENAEKCKAICYHKDEHEHDYACDLGCTSALGIMLSKCQGAEKPSGWQPIETAPKDKPVLLVDNHGYMAACYYDNGSWRLHLFVPQYMDDDSFYLPTHWMELPEGPK